MSRLKDLRIKRGYTQIKMQLLTGIDQSDYCKIENGNRYYTFECATITLDAIDNLCGLLYWLDCTLKWKETNCTEKQRNIKAFT